MSTRPRFRVADGRSWALLVVGLGVMALGFVALIRRPAPRSLPPVTITPGPLGTSRALVAGMLAHALQEGGTDARLVGTSGSEEMMKAVDHGAIDFALVSEAYRFEVAAHIREVAPLYVEALHLLVRGELAANVTRSLHALDGRRVAVGPPGSATADLADAVLEFAGLRPATPGSGGYVPDRMGLEQFEALVARGNPSVLPDAVAHLGTVPSKVALALVHAGYRLVALPFADAFRLNALLEGEVHGAIEREHVIDAVIPAFAYGMDPPMPDAALHTVGARLMLITNDRVPAASIARVLDTVFGSRVARMTYPPLERAVLNTPARLPFHDATIEYVRRGEPYLTPATISELQGTFSALGAVGGGLLFVWQWWRQRTRRQAEEAFGTLMLGVADIERHVAGLELAATLELEPLVALQRRVLELKTEALDRFANGELAGQSALTDLIDPLNAARDHIGDLILHARETLEEQADAEGRSAKAVWHDALAKSKAPAG